MTTRRVTQVVAEVEYIDETAYRRVTQAVAEVEYIDATPLRRVTQLIVEVEYVPPAIIEDMYTFRCFETNIPGFACYT